MELLKEDRYHIVKGMLSEVTFNSLFARAVVQHHVSGSVYVDDVENPSTSYIIHPYGMSLLLGNPGNDNFNRQFKKYALNEHEIRSKPEWLQAFPASWHQTLKSLFKNELVQTEEHLPKKTNPVIEQHTRLNFRFNQGKFLRNKLKKTGNEASITPVDVEIFNNMTGTVVPKSFWDNAGAFLNRGAGFSIIYRSKLASTAYSAFVVDHYLELGIETLPEYQGRGFARAACQALINYCLKNSFEPVWACRKGNIGSIYLAEKLGFEVSMETPFYYLPV